MKNENKKLIYIVDDEPDICELLSLNLKKANFNIKTFYDGNTLFENLHNEIPELIILDIMLPDYDGFEICKQLKNNSKTYNIPIIMLTARDTVEDKVLGLEIGADDYITKPFSPKELIARINVQLRQSFNKSITKKLYFANILELDLDKYEVKVNNKKIDLTLTEYKILKLLAERANKVCSRERIIDYISSHEKYIYDRTVDVHIKNLRNKLGTAAALIKNIRGIGYKLITELEYENS